MARSDPDRALRLRAVLGQDALQMIVKFLFHAEPLFGCCRVKITRLVQVMQVSLPLNRIKVVLRAEYRVGVRIIGTWSRVGPAGSPVPIDLEDSFRVVGRLSVGLGV